MAAIDTDVEKEVFRRLNTDSTIIAFLAKDKNAKNSIRPSGFNPDGPIFPQITYSYEGGKSEPVFPASKGRLHIIVWIEPSVTSAPYVTLKPIAEKILVLFNRKGSSLNNLDVPTNTGIRFTQLLKDNVIFDYDETIKKNFAHIIFDVNVSEGESFADVDAGDKSWV